MCDLEILVRSARSSVIEVTEDESLELDQTQNTGK